MQNKSMRSRWERLFKRKTSQSTPQAVEMPHEASPEIQLLAARITSRLIAHKSEAPLTPEQEAEWKRLKEPLSTMFSTYKMSHLFRRLGTQDNGERQVFQSTLLGVLISDADLLGQFNTALPLPVLEWLPPESEKTTPEIAEPLKPTQPIETESVGEHVKFEAVELVKPVESVTPIEAEPDREVFIPIEAEPVVEVVLPTEAEPVVEVVMPTEAKTVVGVVMPTEAEPVREVDIPVSAELEPPAQPLPVEEAQELSELELLVRELRRNPDFYRVVAALSNNNPGLFKLAALLADHPDISNELDDFFSNSKLGTQLISQQIREER